jgi:hypothetical protein
MFVDRLRDPLRFDLRERERAVDPAMVFAKAARSGKRCARGWSANARSPARVRRARSPRPRSLRTGRPIPCPSSAGSMMTRMRKRPGQPRHSAPRKSIPGKAPIDQFSDGLAVQAG